MSTSTPPAGAPARTRNVSPARVIVAAALLGAAALTVASFSSGDSAPLLRAAAIIGVTITLWATAAVPEYLTAIIFFFLTVVSNVAAPSIAFAGFYSEAVWLVFGGLVLGLAVQQTGLGKRLVGLALAPVGSRYHRLIWLTALAGLLLAFVIPSAMGRALLLIPIAISLADRLGLPPDGNARCGVVLAAVMSTSLPAATILPSNVPNMVLAGAAESIYGVTFRYADYFLLNFTVMGLLSWVSIPILVLLFFPDRLVEPRSGPPGATGWATTERSLALVLAATVALWATDSMHGISPAWVALGAAVVCLFPRYGVLPPRAIGSINFGPWFFVAGIIGLGAVASHTGIATIAGDRLLRVIALSGLADWQQFAGIVLIGMLVTLVTSLPAAPAIMTPLAANLADATGWPLESVLMSQVPTWVVFGFPYQAPPLLVAISLAGLGLRRVMPIMSVYLLFGVLVIFPLQFLWGRWLGVYP